MMKELHSKGTRIEDIAAVLKRSPIHPRIVEAIKSAHALGCDLKNVSDANTFFIETILEHHGLKECFLEINTNPGFVDQQGKLRIFPHHDFTKSSHGCQHPSCLPNMCKDPKKTKIYLGYGLGDGDYVMPRKDVPVWDLICKNRSLIKAQIYEWSDGEEFKSVLLRLISRIISIDGNNTSANIGQLYSVDCKLNTMALPATTGHEAFPQALPVLH
ncbi:hypothetical protein ES288_D05G146000v1 [Gossypium darwinii]|uniref:Inorganic diphosphatase n=1 Tax=Gossypium darwinii TaxID=34276 RepID=A0A5D2CJ73_GOSDA|nr:hypothetical protein ES288_D05G146000v1 [Gossypium darwinii]